MLTPRLFSPKKSVLSQFKTTVSFLSEALSKASSVNVDQFASKNDYQITLVQHSSKPAYRHNLDSMFQ